MDLPVLNPGLDLGGIAKAFARDRRVHIPEILTTASAVRVHRCLEQETDFSLLCRSGDGQAQAWRVAELNPQKEAEVMHAALAGAQEGFHYLHDGHVLSRDGEDYPDSSHHLAAITRFLNSPPVLNLARRVTGNAAIAFADARATRYRRSHFLNQHDGTYDRGHVAAYVLDLTLDWRADWGGALLFSDRAGHLSEGYMPAFNALSIFAVPQEHMVGFVSPFAGSYRLSVSGWFRSRLP
jgi:Rps23 Pro-64 3,4-dihydroxylase Tpa1-like proline 4-hydroxylase